MLASHARIFLLVRVQAVVPFSVVGAVFGNKLLVAVVFLILVSVVLGITDLLALHSPFALAVKAANALVVLVDDAALLCAV